MGIAHGRGRFAPARGRFSKHRPGSRLRSCMLGWLIVGGCICSLSESVLAQNSSPDVAPVKDAPPPNELTVDSIQSKLKKVEESKDLDEAIRLSVMETYKKIIAQIKIGDEFVTKAAGFQKAAQDVPAQLQQVKAELDAPADALTTIDPKMPLAQMQQTLTQAETRLADLQKKLTDLQAEPKRRADRRVEIPKLQDAARKQLADVEQMRAVKPPADENVDVTEANRLMFDARKRAADLELAAYDQELKFYEAAGDLLTARRDLAVVQATQAEQVVKVWRAAVNDRRRAEAEQQAIAARKAALQAHPAVKQLAKESADLTTERQTLAAKIETVTQDSEACEKSLADLDAQFAKVMDRVKRVGLTQAIGLLLRKQRESLPNVESHQSAIEERQIEISKNSQELVDLEDHRAALADIDARTAEIVGQLHESVNSIELPLIEEDIRALLQTKRGYLDSLIPDIKLYLDKLVEYDTRDRQLISKAKDYAAFCDEYILWIHSTDVLQLSDRQFFMSAARWLLSPAGWKDVGDVLLADAKAYPLAYLSGGIVLVLLLVSQRHWRLWLRTAGVEATKAFSTSFRPTATALVLTAMISITWPTLLWLIGYRLDRLSGGSEFVNAIGQSFRFLAVLLVTIDLARHVCCGGGLGEAHFGWPHAVLRLIRRNLRLLLILGLPIAFIVIMMESQSSENARRSLGRVSFLAGQLLLAFCARQIWLATQSMAMERSGRKTWLWTTGVRRVWYVSTVGPPLVLALLAFLGYYYTAMQLEMRLIATAWLMLGLIIVHATLLRGLLMAYRDLAIRRSRERRASEAAAAAAAATTGTTATLGAEASIVPEPTFKLSDVNEQTQKLVRMAIIVALFAGLCLIWVEVLPALRVLRRVELWPQLFNILDAVSTGQTTGILTLADAIVAAVFALVTFAAARNIPGLLEITVLRQLTLDSGVRYAITTVSRYVITVLGILLTFGKLGIAWSHVQWLVAAVSVGLGFGLQEIFANFVSGLILLFERPIRIGDIVSVGDVTGKVTRIRIRATTITDWDMRELVVPNKEFITARVMNWTLTDTLARMTVKVGVAYGTDPNLTRRLLLEVADKNANVLKDPPPHALFDEFGDSTLNFTLRVYLPSLDVFLSTRHEIHSGINAAFQKAGIEIAFPQRDLHIRSTVEAITPGINGVREKANQRVD
ncbi:MAG: mechanosensitive ion channel [Planctomycetes bacterium]|nr:mechanosensitive ion channel [Planctomycetota bacterium]